MSIPASASGEFFNPKGVAARLFGETERREPVTLYTLTNKNGMSVGVMDYGATIVKIVVPDRHGKMADVALGFGQLKPYFYQIAYLGATVGRYANRIANGTFELDGVVHQVPVNNGTHSLHGGTHGFDRAMWKREAFESDGPAVRFSLMSADGDQGYPGNLAVGVTFTLNDANQLRIAYSATTDKPTVINLTNHTYFNLAGAGNGTVHDHVLTLHADRLTPVDADMIPTGEIRDVAGTPWDFTRPTAVGLRLKESGGEPAGYDHNYILKKGLLSKFALAAEMVDPASGRTMKVSTDQPGVQFYTGNFLTGKLNDGPGKVYGQYGGFCLETQHYPDSPNQPGFPSTVLRPGETFESVTEFEFGVK